MSWPRTINKLFFHSSRSGGLSAEEAGAARYLSRLLLRREDRRVGSQWIGKELAAQDHRRSDQNYTGEITRSKGYSVGLLEQEPQLDPNKTVKEIVEEGKKKLSPCCTEYEVVSNRIGEATPDEMEKLLESRRSCKRRSKRRMAGNWRSTSISPWMLSVARPPIKKSTPLSGGEKRRVALCRLMIQEPDILSAGRADEPSRCRIRAVAGTAPPAVQGHGHRGHARPLFPRQRGRLDSRNSIVATAFRSKATIPVLVGNRNSYGWNKKKRPFRSGKKHSSTNWNGSACRRSPS